LRKDRGTAANVFRARVFGADRAGPIAFVCECGDPDCCRTVILTVDEYNQRRPGLLIHDDHGIGRENLIERAG